MPIIKWTPFYEPFLDAERALENISGPQFVPPVDMYEKDGSIIVEVALSGIDPHNVKLSIEEATLSIEASHEQKREVDESHYYRKEVKSGSFHRVVSLPGTVDASKTKADYEKGILTVSMPKKEEKKSQPIEINIKDKA